MCGVISEDIFLKIFKNEDFGFYIVKKGQILRPFSGLAPSKLKLFSKKIKVGYMYIEESFDTIFKTTKALRPLNLYQFTKTMGNNTGCSNEYSTERSYRT